MEAICEKMPKVELHAHLNGSIPDTISLTLLQENKELEGEDMIVLSNDECNLEKCFAKFAQIHKLVKSPEILKMVTCEVIRNFSMDNVIYLEIRTTPKAVHQIQSKDEYIESIIQGILECRNKIPILVKLLISIDRKMGFEDGDENIELAEKWSKKYPGIIAGIDLSGDPTKGSYEWILPLLSKARAKNFKITCHLPEIRNPEEAKQFLEFAPARVGHGLYLHPDHGGSVELWNMMKASNIPMEICITSNTVAGIAFDPDHHHVVHFLEEKLPHVICTDDCGIFNTSLTQEYKKYLKSVGKIGPNELKKLCLAAIDYTFANGDEKEKLKEVTVKWWDQNSDWINKIQE